MYRHPSKTAVQWFSLFVCVYRSPNSKTIRRCTFISLNSSLLFYKIFFSSFCLLPLGCINKGPQRQQYSNSRCCGCCCCCCCCIAASSSVICCKRRKRDYISGEVAVDRFCCLQFGVYAQTAALPLVERIEEAFPH